MVNSTAVVDVPQSPDEESRQGESRAASARKRTAIWAAGVAISLVVLAASVEFVRRQSLDLAAWFATVWALILAVPVPFVIAALVLKASEVALNASAWTTVLRAAYPEQKFSFRQTLGAVQGGVGVLSVIPPKFGGFAVLGIYRVAFPDISITAILATRVVQGISSWLLGFVILLLFGAATAASGGPAPFLDRMAAFYAEQTLLAIIATAIGLALVGAIIRWGRDWLRALVAQLTLGGAILRTPRRYVLRVVAPTLLAFALRWGVTGTLLAAFGIPVTLETLVRVNVSHGIARSVQVTPGGFGTTQAFDLVALRGVAPVEVIAAYSLSQAAILFVFNIAFGLVALIWAFGRERTARLMRLSRRNAAPAPIPAAPQPGVG
jgi:hypothetical protein